MNMNSDQVNLLRQKVGEIIIQESCINSRTNVQRSDRVELLRLKRNLMRYVRRNGISSSIIDTVYEVCRDEVKDWKFGFC